MKKKNLFLYAGLAVGLAIIIFAICMLSLDVSTQYSDSTVKFGGDYNTYSYRAMARTGNNLIDVVDVLKTGFGLLLLAIGLIDICYFGNLLLQQNADESNIDLKATLQSINKTVGTLREHMQPTVLETGDEAPKDDTCA